MLAIDPSVLPGRLRRGTAVLALLLVVGCQKAADLPLTHPARGKVVYADGRPLSGGTIQFAPASSSSSVAVSGAIDNEGRFTLSTIKGSQKVAGAVEGQYQVSIIPPLTDRRQPVVPITLPGAYTVKAGENVFPDFQIPSPTTATPPR
ncbi:MAG TPA: hypothetical protein VMG10_00150 [Gemmataceae bacterium]|nr:hypothetical protein [Gemmataceae bacterium]